MFPVYAHDTLDPYTMSGNQQSAAASQQPQAQVPYPWASYVQSPAYSYIPGQASAPAGHVGWIANPPPPVFAAGQQSPNPAFRGNNFRMGQNGQHGQHHAPHRRHRQGVHGASRPPHARYNNSGGMNHSDQAFNGDHGAHEAGRQGVFPSQLGVAGTGGWSQWNGGR